MDRLFIRGIKFYGFHGVKKEERIGGTIFEVDVELYLSLKKAGRTDKLNNTVNFKEVHSIVLETGRGEEFNLVEGLASRIAEKILDKFSEVKKVTVTVRKFSPPLLGDVDHVGVEISKSRLGRGSSKGKG